MEAGHKYMAASKRIRILEAYINYTQKGRHVASICGLKESHKQSL